MDNITYFSFTNRIKSDFSVNVSTDFSTKNSELLSEYFQDKRFYTTTLSSVTNFTSSNYVVNKTISNELFLESTYGSANKFELSPIEVFENSSTDNSVENNLNYKRIQTLNVELSKKLLHLLREQEFEYGFNSPADEMVQKCLKENQVVTKQWLNQLFISNFSDPTVTVGLLRVISHLDYEQIAPQGPTMALAALSNRNSEIQECGIRAFENWVHPESLRILKEVHCHESWLEDYLKQVIVDLTSELL